MMTKTLIGTSAPTIDSTPQPPVSSGSAVLKVGRYVLYDEIASGGMASVHLGRLMGSVGFARTVAIKRLHPHFAKDVEFVRMFLDEAHIAARLRHPNVVPILDVVHTEDELFLVMDYVEGESLSRLFRLSKQRKPLPIPIAIGIVTGVLHGLHAAHEACNDAGEPLNLVHRDVSPQNVIVGADGVPRVLDFGIAKASGNLHQTTEGQLKGKIAYMAPEQVGGDDLDRHADIYAAGVVLWELLTQTRLFRAKTEALTFARVLKGVSTPPSRLRSDIPKAVDDVVMKALSAKPHDRFATARGFALALETACPGASSGQIGRWVEETAASSLARRAEVVAGVESQPGMSEPADSTSESLRMKITGTNPKIEVQRDSTMVSSSTEVPHVHETTASDHAERRSPPYTLMAIGLLFLGVVLVSMRLGTTTAAHTPETAAPSTPLESVAKGPLQNASATSAPRPSQDPDPTVVSSAEEPSPAKSSKPTPRARPWRARQAPAPSAAPAAEPTPAAAPKPPSCDPPFYIDAKGIQRIKTHCL